MHIYILYLVGDVDGAVELDRRYVPNLTVAQPYNYPPNLI